MIMENMDNFFTNAFENFEDKEELYKAMFMNADGWEAAKVRIEYYKKRFKSCGENIYIGKGVSIGNPEAISLGNNVCISDGATIIARSKDAAINIGNNVTICQRVYLDTERDDSTINIGNDVYIGTGTSLFGHMGLDIGDHCLLAQNISLTPYSHKFENPDDLIANQGGNCKKVTIGRDTYVGMNATILYSGDIGEGCVVGSGTVVVKPLEPYSIAVGNPARVLRKRGEPKKIKE